MAYDKAVDSTALENGLTTIADAIRAKGGTSAPLEFPQGMADAVAAISGGGGACSGVIKLFGAGATQPFKDSDIPDGINIEVDYASRKGKMTLSYFAQGCNNMHDIAFVNGDRIQLEMYGAFTTYAKFRGPTFVDFSRLSGTIIELTSAFTSSRELRKIRFAANQIESDIDLSFCGKLVEKESYESVVAGLSNSSVGKTASFQKSKIDGAFSGGSAGAEWQALVSTKANWTITLK